MIKDEMTKEKRVSTGEKKHVKNSNRKISGG
jgi:hypothetical protein